MNNAPTSSKIQCYVVRYFFHDGSETDVSVQGQDLAALAQQGLHGTAPEGAQMYDVYACYGCGGKNILLKLPELSGLVRRRFPIVRIP